MTLQATALGVLDAVADACGLLRRPLRPDDLVEAVRRRTGLHDFGDVDFTEPLQRLLEACVNEASLGAVGRMATRWDVVRFLSNLLRLRQEERVAPAVLDERIERPIFITGLPRSGTTFLHRLMMLDAVNRTPLVWQTIYPYPETSGGQDTRQARVSQQLHAFERLAPDSRDLHPLHADSPQECSEIAAHTFRSLRFDTTYRIPSYRAWLDNDLAGHLPAYRLHKRFLQHLQHQDRQDRRPGRANRRWVLKCPDHVFALDAIRAVYPDARLVFVHRDPLRVLLSVAKLTEVLRRPFARFVDRAEVGRQESARWLDGTRRMMAASNDVGSNAAICHVHYLDIVSDPVGTVDSVYRHFGLELPEAAAQAMQRLVETQPNGGYGPRDYRFGDHGLDPEAERAKFRPYLVHFGITPEAVAVRRDAAARRAGVSMRPNVEEQIGPSAEGTD